MNIEIIDGGRGMLFGDMEGISMYKPFVAPIPFPIANMHDHASLQIRNNSQITTGFTHVYFGKVYSGLPDALAITEQPPGQFL